MDNILESMVGHRLTINAKLSRPQVGPQIRAYAPQMPSETNNPFLKSAVYSNSNLIQRHDMPNPFGSLNMVQNSNHQKTDCRCDPEFVNFCKLHTISHSECAITRQVCCQLCATSADFKSIQWHLSSDKHKQRHQQLMEYVFLLSLPSYSRSQAIKITDLLEHVYIKVSLNMAEYESRVQAVNRLNELMKNNGLNNFSLRIYGSTITRTSTNNGFALNASDLNLEIIYAENVDKTERSVNALAMVLGDLLCLVEKNPNLFHDIRKDFNLKTPKLRFRDRLYNLSIEVSIGCEKSYRLSKLLQQYCEIDDRVSKLGIAFREWARVYGFDDQENGLWPSFTFPILCIHFLQHCTPPVLPCLHELLAKNQQPNSAENVTKEETLIHSHSSKLILEDNETVEDFFNLNSLNWQKLNTKSVGELWLDMLRYYSVQFNSESYAVSIRTTKFVRTHEDKKWGTKMMAVEDPARPSLNLSRSVGSMRLYNTFMEQLKFTYKYFWIPFIEAPVYSGNLNVKPLFTERDFEILVNQNHPYDNIDMNDISAQIDQIHNSLTESEPKNENANHIANHRASDDSDSDDENKKKENFHLKAHRILRTFGIWMELFPELQRTAQLIPSNQLSYTFALHRMPFYQKPQKYCRLCYRYGHLQSNCPEQELPRLLDLPPVLAREYDNMLSNMFEQIYKFNKMDDNDIRIQTIILTDLENFIQRELPNARLALFGSTRNGFGARNCDLDICMTFNDNPTGEGLDVHKILEQVTELLRLNRKLIDIQVIGTAKVPIVKFKYILDTNSTVECDFTMYNILAVHNTDLLSTYTKIDDRVQILGFVVKHFAKVCDMCDASRGSLSSYAYTLMTIHYLQQRGIIPVLQEIGLDQKMQRIVEGWDTWFFSDLENLNKYWKREPNNESVAQLFYGFLKYYSEVFNYDDCVICCRQLAPLSRLEKFWTGSKISIEDPFRLTHNLGAGVSAQMAVFIKTAFIKGRNHFGNQPTNELDMNRFRNWPDYFFSRNMLTNGLPPTGRGCRSCGKIGHKQNMCPERRGKRDIRDRQERYERQERNDRPNYRIITARQDRNDKYEKNIRNNNTFKDNQNERQEHYERMDRTDRNKFDRNGRQDRLGQQTWTESETASDRSGRGQRGRRRHYARQQN